MKDPAGALAARIEEFERAADPGPVLDETALAEAEEAMRACTGGPGDAAVWRLVGVLHLARYRLAPEEGDEAAVAGVFFAAVAVLDPRGLPARLRGPHVPDAGSAETWAGLVEQVFQHVDVEVYPHVGLLVHALLRRALAEPTPEVCDRLGRVLLEQALDVPAPAWAADALAILGNGLVRLYRTAGDAGALDDAVHALFRAALAGPGHVTDLAAALGHALPGDTELIRAYLLAAGRPAGPERSDALLALLDLTSARASASHADADLLALLRAGQACLDHWHEAGAHPEVLSRYGTALIDWYVVTGDLRSLEAGRDLLATAGTPASGEGPAGADDPAVRLNLLGRRHRRRHQVSGDPADLEIAVQTLRQAVVRAPEGHPDRPAFLADLAEALARRAARTGDSGAVTAARAAVAACEGRHPRRPRALLLLGRALNAVFSPDTADEAVTALRDALAMEDDPGFQAEAYAALSDALRRRAMASGEPGMSPAVEAVRRTADLDAAVQAARRSADLASPPEPALVKGLLARFVVRGDEKDLAEALERAGNVPGGDPELSCLLRQAVGAVEAPDGSLAEAATRLALTCDDETTRTLIRLGEDHAGAAATESGSEAGGAVGTAGKGAAPEAAGVFLADVAAKMAERGRRRTAIELLERAERAFGDAGETARAADTSARIGHEHARLGAWEAALRRFELAADRYRAIGRTREEAAQRAAMGDACAGAGEPRRAAACHQRAVELCREAGLDSDEAAYQEKAAAAYLEAGDRAEALERAGHARDLHLARGDAERAARALITGARAGAELGHLPAAAELISTCAAELEAIGKWDDACHALDGHAVLLYDLGHDDHAAACETAVVDVVRRHGRQHEPADEWYHIARRRLARGDVPGARRALERAERGYHQVGHRDGVAAVRHQLGIIGFTGAGMEQAVQDFGTAAEAYADPAREAAARTMRAACLVELGRRDEASAELDRATRPALADGDIGALFSITLVRATADLRSGHPARALERLRAAMGLAAGDPLREAVVHERLAAVHASRVSPLGSASGDGAVNSRPRRPEVGQEVVEHLGLAVDGFRATGRDGLAALVSSRLGFALEERGDLRRARKALEEGLGASVTGPSGDTPYEVIPVVGADPSVLVRLAGLRFAVGEVRRGRATLAQALAAVRRGGTDPALAERLAERVRIEDAEEAGDLTGALALARRAADAISDPRRRQREVAADVTGEALRRSGLLVKLCALALAAGDPEGAYAYASEGCELGDDLVAEHLRGRGVAAAALGRTGEAIAHLSESVRLARESGQAMPVRLVAALGALGAALAEDRRWAEAQAVLAEGLALAAGPTWRGMRASLLAVRARTRLRQGDADEAAALYREALMLGEAAGDDATVATVCMELAPVQAAAGDRDGAIRLAGRALDIDRARGRQRAVVRDLIALGRLGEDDRLPEALTLAQRTGFTEGQAVALAGLAALDLRAGRFTAAKGRASAAIDLLEGTAHGHPGDGVGRSSGGGAGQGLGGGGERLPAGGAHRPELAGAYAVRAAAREELGELSAALADAEHAGVLDDPCPEKAEVLRSRTVRLAVRLGHASTAWTHAERARQTTPWPVDDTARAVGGDAGRLVSLLPSRTGVVAFHAFEGSVSVVAHRDGWAAPRVFATSAGPELLAGFAVGVRESEGGRRRADLWREVADRLLAETVEALGDDLDALYLLPHGDLHGLPLHALAPGGRLLLDRYAVAYAPSATTLAALTLRHAERGGSRTAGRTETAAGQGRQPETPTARAGQGGEAGTAAAPGSRGAGQGGAAGGVAAPGSAEVGRSGERGRTAADSLGDLRRGTDAVGSSSGGTGAEGRSLVAGRGEQAEVVAAVLGVEPVTVAARDLEGVWDVVHLACPACYDSADPYGSGLRLPGGLLNARALGDLRIDARVVSVAGCEPTAAGAGVAALGDALLRAGADAVLLPQWPVRPEAAGESLPSFHAYLATHGPGEALRLAMLESRELYGSSRPELWAPYALIGLADVPEATPTS